MFTLRTDGWVKAWRQNMVRSKRYIYVYILIRQKKKKEEEEVVKKSGPRKGKVAWGDLEMRESMMEGINKALQVTRAQEME